MKVLKDMLSRLTMARALILGVAFAAIYYFVVYDSGEIQKQAISNLQSELDKTNREIDEAQQKLNRAAGFKKTAAEVGSTINKLLTTIPEKFGLPDLMRIVSNEAKTAGSSLATITPNVSVVSPVASEFEELSVNIDLTGSFLQHMVFLSNLTKVNQILIIRKFEIQTAREAKGDESNLVKMVAEIVAFRYRGSQLAKNQEKTQ